VGAASGRLDALAFIAGLVAGVWLFAEAYAALAGFVWSGDLGPVTFAELLGVPFWALAAAFVVITLALAAVLRRVEGHRGERRGSP
jgi:membrane protein implicated in regulation of membrane protease activity